MFLHQAIVDYKGLCVPPPPRLERSDLPPLSPHDKKKHDYQRTLRAFRWELPNALYYIHSQYARKKEQFAHGHHDPAPPDLNDYLACLQEGHLFRQLHHEWSPLERLIHVSRDIPPHTKESLLLDVVQGNREGVLRYLWCVCFADLHAEEMLQYDALLD
jgi:hypothetical protein